MKLIFSILIGILGLNISSAVGQTDTIGVQVILWSYGDSIAVRWAPLNKESWKYGNAGGYQLKKLVFEIQEDEEILVETVDLGIFRPLPANEWTAVIDETAFAKVPYFGMYEYEPTPVNLADLSGVLTRVEEAENVFGFSILAADYDFRVAQASGLGYMDKSVEAGLVYKYKVVFGDKKDSYELRSSSPKITPYPKSVLPEPTPLDGVFGDQTVELKWNSLAQQKDYTGYYIERSSGTDNNFIMLNQAPIVPMTEFSESADAEYSYYKNDSLQNFKSYTYRIRGLSPFGDLGPPTNLVRGMPTPSPLSSQPIITDVWENDDNTFEIKWFFDPAFIDQIKYFKVFRSTDFREQFDLLSDRIEPTTVLSFIDANPASVNFYRITAIDINDHELVSADALGQLKDETPPLVPSGLKGICDTSGLVTLSWNKNQELDLAGYYVFQSNTENGEYSILTNNGEVKDSLYQDSLLDENFIEHNYYKILALDFRGNQSDFSKPIKVKIPDKAPPIKPVFKSRKILENQIQVSWTNSASSDILVNQLQRKSRDSIQWITLLADSTRGTTRTYLDTLVQYSTQYNYRILATDDDGLTSASDIIVLQPIDDGKRNAIIDFIVKLDEDKMHNEIRWNYPTSLTDIKKLTIYRSTNENKLVSYKTQNSVARDDNSKQPFFIIDDDIKSGVSYQYKILIRFKDRSYTASNISNSIKVK